MAKIIEKRVNKIPPCRINKDLIRKLGNILESESSKFYSEIKDLKRIELSESDFYIKYPEDLEKAIENKVYERDYLPSYELTSISKNISSFNVDKFIETEWPSDVNEISLSIGSYTTPKKN